MIKRRLNINLPKEEHLFLKRLADIAGVSMTRLIRKWIGREGGPYMDSNDNSRYRLSRDIRPFPPTVEDLCTLVMNIIREYDKVEEITIKSGKPVSFSYWVDKDGYKMNPLSIFSLISSYPIDDVTPLVEQKTPIETLDLMWDTMYSKGFAPVCFIVNKADPWKWINSRSIMGRKKSLFFGYPVFRESSIGDDRILLVGAPKRELGTGAACYAVQVAVDIKSE